MSLMHPAISRSGYALIRLLANAVCLLQGGISTYQAHRRVGVDFLLLLPSAAIWLTLGAELLAHSGAVKVHLGFARVSRDEIYVDEQSL